MGAKRPPARYAPPPPCPLPYAADGSWTDETSLAARRCVRLALRASLGWWRAACAPRPAPPLDVDATLCRLRGVSARAVLTNMLLLRSSGGRLSAAILIDPSDERGPMRHWPARPVAALQQLAELQSRIDAHEYPPLPDFVAVLNPHDSPYQMDSNNWCGLAPILSNSRVTGEHRDLLMPDFSFAPLSYLTNMLEANMSAALSVPQGWPAERQAIYAAGKRRRWREKEPSLFWRGGETHVQRREYAEAISSGRVKLGGGVKADVVLCGAHCSLEQGVRPEDWCAHQQLLSLPGHSFAVGFKYTMLCSSTVVRGAHPAAGCVGCPRVFEQWWSVGLKEGEHYLASRRPDDLPSVVGDAAAQPDSSELIAARGSEYTYRVLSPAFINEYWHTLLSGYASLFSGEGRVESAAAACKLPHRNHPQNERERVCMRGTHGMCQFKLVGEEELVPLPTPAEIAAQCRTTAGMQASALRMGRGVEGALYRRFATILPMRITGRGNASEAAVAALQSWLQGDNKKAPRDAPKSQREEKHATHSAHGKH
ncbi:hypothetical protein AB1Y20_013314 [Prymnesium parvum]|uniref:Glycosyl transferase CAP10 domain-containing protein n=1 Tax=Prymnesium parvum TaxID=97485 RepID=A0AB34IMZ3_PRYPA